MSEALRAWRATLTTRWHRHPELRGTLDDIGGHQHRTAVLAMMLFPHKPIIMQAAMLHDMGEAAVGDVPNPVKNRYPSLKAALDAVETVEMEAMGIPSISLAPEDQAMLRLCDKLDAYLWAALHRPDLMGANGWPDDRAEIIRLATQSDRLLSVEKILNEALA